MKTIKTQTKIETIVSDGIGEINVRYKGYWDVDIWDLPVFAIDGELESVELVIKGEGIEILPLLSERQIKAICNELTGE